MLLEGREKQYLEANKSDKEIIFFDRGIPDIFAYLNYFNTEYPSIFIDKSKKYLYDKVFLFLPWKEIYLSDNERYESFEQSNSINSFLINAYKEIGYQLITVPFGSIEDRSNFILNSIKDKK